MIGFEKVFFFGFPDRYFVQLCILLIYCPRDAMYCKNGFSDSKKPKIM
jgi:hypothetical protein